MATTNPSSDPKPPERENGNGVALSDRESAVLQELEERSGLDTIEIASALRLDVELVHDILLALLDKGLVARADPEPVRERFALDRDALKKTLA